MRLQTSKRITGILGGMSDLYAAGQRRTKWFQEARFGLFIHWGLYAIPARGEWVRNRERISNEAYQPYFEQFNPDRFTPAKWARMAREAGMRYAVLTAKHHDGFCLFDSKLTDYTSTQSPARRDFVREYVEAFRSEGLRVGLYYSLLDWHHPSYPAYADDHHPMRGHPDFQEAKPDFSTYVDYLHGQVRELLTNYGKIDLLWFDFSYGEMTGEKWEASRLVQLVRELQPQTILDNRLGGSLHKAEPESYAGDFETPEQYLPTNPLLDELGRPIPWEACVTQNGNWGFHREDASYLSARQTIRTLVNCVSKGGNLLINTGPDARGQIPAEQQKILEQVGNWMQLNGESIYNAGASEFPKPEWGRLTQSGNRLFCHIQDPGMGTLVLPGLGKKLRRPRLLATGHEIPSMNWVAERHLDDAFMILGREETAMDPVVEWEIVPG